MGSLELLINISWGFTFLILAALYYIPSKYKAASALAVIVINAAITSYWAIGAIMGSEFNFTLEAGSFMNRIPFRIDGLSAWFILLINFSSITASWYALYYLKNRTPMASRINLHWQLMIALHLSMLWICMLQHGLAFIIAWEIMSVSSMILLTINQEQASTLKSTIQYMVQMHISGALLTIGFLWVYVHTGSFSFDAFHAYFGANSNIWLFLIFFIGFGLKSEFIPLHGKVPNVYPQALPHVAAIMSGIMVKMGIYGIIRIITFLHSDYILLGAIVLTVSVITGFYGIFYSAIHRDIKRMLAYCSIENIGIIGIGIGTGLIGMGTNNPMLYYLGFGGALLHAMNHSLYKTLLFYVSGSVFMNTQTNDMDKLGGVMKQMPHSGMLFLCGAIAIGGLPPFNGFLSEFLIYIGLIEGLKLDNLTYTCLFVITLGGLSIIGGVSVMSFTKAFGTIFLGNNRQQSINEQTTEVSKGMLAPQYLTLAAMAGIVVFAPLLLNTINHILSATGNPQWETANIFDSTSSIITHICYYSALFAGITGIVWMVRQNAMRNSVQTEQPTWTCSCPSLNTRMQYTGKSFSKTLGKIFNFLVIETKREPQSARAHLFPRKRKYQSFYLDIVEHRILDIGTKYLLYIFNFFKFIQNGHTQSYVLYGIVFILAIFVLSIFNLIQ